MINCPNPECQAANPEGNETCVSCQTFLPHRYLWAVGHGELGQLDQRYSWQHQRVVLDTQPGIPPTSPEPVPSHIWPYLMLAPHSLHMPQPYALLNDRMGNEILLLDMPAIATPPGEVTPRLLPKLVDVWQTASPLRQLNWLWQVAGLWPDFMEQQVASSLLLGESLRVHGSLVRLLELSSESQPLTLKTLGASWQTLIPQAQPSIQNFLTDLCSQLDQETITTPEVLVACLDQAMATAASGCQLNYQLSVLTHQGPIRKRNEDACYPASGTTQTHKVGPNTYFRKQLPLLLLVCDGIGGHEGGDVASQLAIATIQKQLAPLIKQLSSQSIHDPGAITLAIEQAICAANDQISQHNDQGLRQARDRMGTTLVMALIVDTHIYIAHVGDSRAYRISHDSCRQITFDDDVAAREVRLGYGFYADVTNRPGTGALIQALGMGHSSALHIVVQRLILDEDIVLLLCSDGLSDYDRIEQFWRAQLLPVLTKQTKPATAVTNLVEIANTHNGHDNVTVGIIAGHLKSIPNAIVPGVSLTQSATTSLPTLSKTRAAATVPPSHLAGVPQNRPTQSATKKTMGVWSMLLSIVSVLGVATVLVMLFFRNEPALFSKEPASTPAKTIQEEHNRQSEGVGITDDELEKPLLTPGSYLHLSQPVILLAAPQATANDNRDNNELGPLQPGTIVQVLTRQDVAGDQSLWVKLKVCILTPARQSTDSAPSNVETSGERALDLSSTPSASTVTSPSVPSLTSGTQGWVLEAQLVQTAYTAERLNCAPE